MSFRVDRNTRCSNSSTARLSTAPRSAGTSSDWEPSAFETRAESIGMCRKRSFATGWRGRRPARAAVCRIPCLILCLADVQRVDKCRAPHAPWQWSEKPGAPQPRVSLAPMAAGNLPLINVQHSRDGGRHSEAVVCFELGHATDYVSER